MRFCSVRRWHDRGPGRARRGRRERCRGRCSRSVGRGRASERSPSRQVSSSSCARICTSTSTEVNTRSYSPARRAHRSAAEVQPAGGLDGVSGQDRSPGLHIHDLRLTGNTLPAAARASNRDLMARMGHDSTIGHIDRAGERQSTASAGAFALPHRGLLAWSGRRESNPHYQLGRLKFCH
jgi:hypothetical protein